MGLSSDLISQFVKITKDEPEKKKESVASGTVVRTDSGYGIKLDGSLDDSEPIPVSADDNTTTTELAEGNRVLVTIRNHTAIITGNLSSPSVGTDVVSDIRDTANDASNKADVATGNVTNLSNRITEFGVAIGTKVEAEEFRTALASVTSRLDAKDIQVQELTAKDVEISGKIDAANAEIEKLHAKDVEVSGKVTAAEGDISELKTDKLDAKYANNTYATIENLNAINTEVDTIKGNQASFAQTTTGKFTAIEAMIENLTGTSIEGKYANIDFSNIGEAAIRKIFSDTGMISDLVVGDGTITGKLAGVTISGDLIEGNTVKADKLVVKGEDGLYYKLNIDAGVSETEEVTADDLQNGLHGSAIIAKTITAEQISVTDLVAFGATIGGFEIDENAIHSVAKDSASNTTRGVYMDNDGQFVVGDASNYIKYFKDTEGQYKLDISMLSSYATKNDVDNIKIGGRNLLTDSEGEFIGRNEFLQSGHDLAPIFAEHGLVEYTLSMDIKSEDVSKVKQIQVYCQNGVGALHNIGSPNFTVTTEWQRFSHTFTPSVNANSETKSMLAFFGGAYNTGNIPRVRRIKLELGNKATDWTPAPEETDNKITSLDGRLTSSEASIAVLSDSLTANVTETTSLGTRMSTVEQTASDLSVKFNDLRIGGRNLLKNTETAVENDGYSIVKYAYADVSQIKAGEKYTVSFDGKLTDPSQVGFYINTYPAPYSACCSISAISTDGEYYRYVTTFTMPDNGSFTEMCIYPQPLNNGKIAGVKNVKLEKGDKATDWTPAPEDVETSILDASKTATNFMSFSTDGLVVGDMTAASLGKNILIGATDIKIRTGTTDNAVFGAALIELAKYDESTTTAENTATISMLNGAFKIHYDSDSSDGGFGIYGKTSDGNERLAFQPVNENGNLTLGWGGYKAGENSTNIYGYRIHLIGTDEITIGSNYGDDPNVKKIRIAASEKIEITKGSVTYKPYYEAGDSVEIEWYGAGFVSTSGTVVFFSVPLSKPIIGSPSVTAASVSDGGLRVRQAGNYVYGAASSTHAKPSSYKAAVSGEGNYVRIEATMANSTNAVNNDACGVHAKIQLTFS